MNTIRSAQEFYRMANELICIQRTIESIEDDLRKEVEKRRKAADAKLAPYLAKEQRYQTTLAEFARDRIVEVLPNWPKKKSGETALASYGFRDTPDRLVPDEKVSDAERVERVKQGLPTCIRTREEVDLARLTQVFRLSNVRDPKKADASAETYGYRLVRGHPKFFIKARGAK